jgi:hypothetical protein
MLTNLIIIFLNNLPIVFDKEAIETICPRSFVNGKQLNNYIYLILEYSSNQVVKVGRDGNKSREIKSMVGCNETPIPPLQA